MIIHYINIEFKTSLLLQTSVMQKQTYFDKKNASNCLSIKNNNNNIFDWLKNKRINFHLLNNVFFLLINGSAEEASVH
jgi:hypothetical protein